MLMKNKTQFYFIFFLIAFHWCLTNGQLGTLLTRDADEFYDDDEMEESVTDTTERSPSTPANSLSAETSLTSTYVTSELNDIGDVEDEHCYAETDLVRFCDVPEDMADLTFWDMFSVMFSDSVLQALVEECPMGTWCLQDRFDIWDAQLVERADMVMKSEIAESMCRPEVTSCFEKITNFFDNCTVQTQIGFTTEAIELMCHLRENAELTQNCVKQVLVSLHVTVANVIRSTSQQKATDENQDTCESPVAHMTKRLICMENSCPGEGAAFKQFLPWLWFTEVVDGLINKCGINPTKCVDVLQVGETSTSAPLTSSVTSLSRSSKSSTTPSQYSSSPSYYSSTNTWNLWETLLTESTSRVDTVTSSKNVDTVTSSKSVDTVTSSTIEDTIQSPMSVETMKSSSSESSRAENGEQPLAEELYTQELGLMVGGSMAVTVLAIIMTLLACTLYRRHRRNAVLKDGYQKLLNDGDES